MGKYETTIRKLYSANLHQRVKMGLTNVSKLLTALDSSYIGNKDDDTGKKPIIVHVAGTNGKGSVCWKLANSLKANGLKTGLFVSPHISCFRERVQIDGRYISQNETIEILNNIFHVCEEQKIPSTFFEMTTALAFQHFENENVDALVLETGLGGRLDSTNIIVPDISIVTSISLDHTKILGNTVEEITNEKGGIIKPKVPVVIGPRCQTDLLQKIANEQDAELYQVDEKNYDLDQLDFCIENEQIARLAFNVLKNDGKIIECEPVKTNEAMLSSPPCRFQLVDRDGTTIDTDLSDRHPDYLLDVAHNPDAIRLLFSRYNSVFNNTGKLKKPRVVVGFSVDKDIEKCLKSIMKYTSIDRIYPVAANHPRAMNGIDLKDLILKIYKNEHDNNDDDNNNMSQILNEFNKRVNNDGDDTYDIGKNMELARIDSDNEIKIDQGVERLDIGPIVFCGSIYSMNEAMSFLNVPLPDVDSTAVQKAWEERKVGMQNDPDESFTDKFKDFFKKYDVKKVIKQYGMIGFCFHTTCYFTSLGCVYAAMSNGLEFPEATEYLSENLGLPEEAGIFAIAWGVNAWLTSVPRTVLTVVATPTIAKYLGYKEKKKLLKEEAERR